MANQTIHELGQLTLVGVDAANDEFVLWDADAATSKRITVSSMLSALATLTGLETLTNKRINPRVKVLPYNDATITVGETSDYNTDLADRFNVFSGATGLAQDTNFGAPGGTPVDGQVITFVIKGGAADRNLTWNAVYVNGGVALPLTVTAGKFLKVVCQYNAADTTWDCVGALEKP